MTSPSSILSPSRTRRVLRPVWTQELGGRGRGLSLAREKGWTLAWDDRDNLHVFNRKGELQARARFPCKLAAACSAADGSAHVALGVEREIAWLAPDLTVRWQQQIPQTPVAATLDPFGQYVAVADQRGALRLLDKQGSELWQEQSPRPFHQLAFVPAAPFLLGSADYGLVACYGFGGQSAWRDGLVAHIGSMSLSGDGGKIVLACFSEGLQVYDLSGRNKQRLATTQACRLADVSFDGRRILTAGMSHQLCLLDDRGQVLCEHVLEKSAVAIALGALGDRALCTLADGRLICFDLRDVPAGS